MSDFIYTPRSGTKIFAQGFGVTVETRPWGEGHTAAKARGSHDLDGHVDVVTVEASTAGSWWREKGRRWFRLLVAECGGVAVDVCGTLSYYAPTAAAARAARLVVWHCLDAVDDREQRARIALELALAEGAISEHRSWVAAEAAILAARAERLEAQRVAEVEPCLPDAVSS